jgi:hypothetical protein
MTCDGLGRLSTLYLEILSNVFKLGRAMREDELEDEVDKDDIDDLCLLRFWSPTSILISEKLL